jgi:Uma2 family endonuclease
MTTLKQQDLPDYSFEDYQRWEGGWELIAGIPYSMIPAPVKNHQMLVGYIFSEISQKTDGCPNCEILIDEDWKLDSNTVLKPDVSVVCNDNNPSYIAKTPEIIFEVLSPSTAKRDEGLKFNMYEEEGVKYYTLIYPDDLVAKVYKLKDGHFKKEAECDTETYLFDDITCPFELDFSVIFKRFRK